MAVILKSQREIDLMREAGSVVAKVLLKLKEMAKPGVSTGQLDSVAMEMSVEVGAKALFKGVRSPATRAVFPGAICASINEQIVHGIPSETVILKEGDILSIDFGIRLNGYCGDAAITVGIGEISEINRKLIEVTQHALEIAVSQSRPGVKWSTIAGKIQSFTESSSFSVVRDFVGHGIGREMHEGPRVPNFVSNDLLRNDVVLTKGMVLAVEPMINAGSYEVRTLKDGWTVVTRDKKCSAHFEHTIAITDTGCEVLTNI